MIKIEKYYYNPQYITRIEVKLLGDDRVHVWIRAIGCDPEDFTLDIEELEDIIKAVNYAQSR